MSDLEKERYQGSLSEQDALLIEGASMLIAQLIVKRTCRVVEKPGAPGVSRVINFLMRHPNIPPSVLIMPAEGNIQGDPKKQRGIDNTLRRIDKFDASCERDKFGRRNGLVIVRDVDYMGKSGGGTPQIAERLSGITGLRDSVMALTIGTGPMERPHGFVEKLNGVYTLHTSGLVTLGEVMPRLGLGTQPLAGLGGTSDILDEFDFPTGRFRVEDAAVAGLAR